MPTPLKKVSFKPFFIVGVGASAGGLEAFTELLHALPAETNMAFVLIQHLAPLHDSLLTQLLSKATSLPVSEVVNNTLVQPGHIYVIPPNMAMNISNGTLFLAHRKDIENRSLTIDAFFVSLAQDQKERAIGIVLSGSNFDGALGLERIKIEGGITFAQDEDSAKFKEMPHKAAASGIVDFILPPQAIARKLSRLATPILNPYFKAAKKQALSARDQKALDGILEHLKLKTGMDFAFYKPATIIRRISRRMALQRVDSLEGYFRNLRKNADEAQALRKDLLINVTRFFREPESFELLKTIVFPEILNRQPKGGSVRIWVPGCSTGNEVYSIAMCLDEFLKGKALRIQIFATDVSDAALEHARRGVYPENIGLDVSTERLERYFQKVEGGYQIKKYIRDLCVFASHNMINDPPFSAIDLISCRNVMIYMEPQLQKKALSLFHYSLKSLGFLMLGGSESIGEFSDYFSQADRKQRLFTKKKALKSDQRPRFVLESSGSKSSLISRPHKTDTKASDFDVLAEAGRVLAGKDAKDGVLVSEAMEIIEFYGHTQPYIKHAPGQASFSLLQMVHESLLPDLCIAIYRAKKESGASRKDSHVLVGSKYAQMEITVVRAPSSEECYFLILFKKPEKPSRKSKSTAAGRRQAQENQELKRELLLAKESLVAIIREQGSLTEEFSSQNEEMMSSNEEYQSTNEELETAKEELQSTNEELTTVNSEMEVRNLELINTNDDLNNLILGIHTPIILVDGNLRVRRFTTKAGKGLGIVASDVGRKITEISLTLRFKSLEAFIRDVMDCLQQKEIEVEDSAGDCYLMRARPYLRQDGKIDGVVLMFVDIMDIKQSMIQLQHAKHYSETIIETLWEPLVALDSDLKIKTANKSFCDFFKVSKQETHNRIIYSLGNGQWDILPLKKLLEELLSKNESFFNFEMEHDFPKIGHKLMLLNAHKVAVKGSPGEEVIILAFQDITERRRAEAAMTEIAEQLVHSNSELENFALTAAHDLLTPIRKIHIFGERLLTENLSEKGMSYLKIMIRSSSRMRDLVEYLLQLSRITSRGGKREPISLSQTAEEVVIDLEVSVQEQHAVIEYDGLPCVTANRIEMHQLFQNLIGNALKYRRPDAAPRVLITGRVTDDAVEIDVKDNGIGFDEKHAQEVFKPFMRLRTIVEYEGSGIGLALCKKIMKNHGGDISVQSVPGQGSTFTLQWPLAALCGAPSL